MANQERKTVNATAEYGLEVLTENGHFIIETTSAKHKIRLKIHDSLLDNLARGLHAHLNREQAKIDRNRAALKGNT